jgi:hypothetical protein
MVPVGSEILSFGICIFSLSRDCEPISVVLRDVYRFYPESMHKMYVVNAPWVFKAIWAVVRPWLHPITQSKIHVRRVLFVCCCLASLFRLTLEFQVCGSSFLEELEKDGIGKDKLPDFLGTVSLATV